MNERRLLVLLAVSSFLLVGLAVALVARLVWEWVQQIGAAT